jgi:hypothetical protein
MEHAGKTLWTALRRVARPERPLDLLAAVWPVILGPRLAAHTQPVAWHKGVVTVDSPDAEWHAQLAGLAAEIRKQINRWWGTDVVTEVRVAPARRGGFSGTASRRASKQAPRPASGKPESAESKLDAALQDLEPALRGIKDDELRDLITRVACKYLAGKKTK